MTLKLKTDVLNLLVILVGILALQFFPAKPLFAAEIYFVRDDAKPWQNCYADMPASAALKRIESGDFEGADIIPAERKVELNGKKIEMSFNLYGRDTKIEFNPCVFSQKDLEADLNCEIVIQDPYDGRSVSFLNHLKNLEEKWKVELVSCQTQQAPMIRNSWRQKVSLAKLKLYRNMLKIGHTLAWSTSTVVKKGESTHEKQNWSANIDLNVMEPLAFAEYCDASVVEVSTNFEVYENKVWCPWGVEIVRLNCDGQTPLVNHLAAEWMSVTDLPRRCSRSSACRSNGD